MHACVRYGVANAQPYSVPPHSAFRASSQSPPPHPPLQAPKRVLLAVDASPHSDLALAWCLDNVLGPQVRYDDGDTDCEIHGEWSVAWRGGGGEVSTTNTLTPQVRVGRDEIR